MITFLMLNISKTNNYRVVIDTLVYIFVTCLLICSCLTHASWFDNITPPENAKYNIEILYKAFNQLTQGKKPLVDDITSKKVWFEWEDPEPLKSQDYLKIAKFYQFNKEKTLLTRAFNRSSNIDNPINSFDYLAQVFFYTDDNLSYTNKFINEIITGNITGKKIPTVFEQLDEAAKNAIKDKNGEILRYSIRKIRAQLESLCFPDVLEYALLQTKIDSAKFELINTSKQQYKNNKSKYKIKITPPVTYEKNIAYNFFNNEDIIKQITNILIEDAILNKGLLQDLKQIKDLNDLLENKKFVRNSNNIIEKINNKLPLLASYFSNKDVATREFIATHLLPQPDILCTKNVYYISNIVCGMLSSTQNRSGLYKYNFTEKYGFSRNVHTKTNTKRNKYSYRIPLITTSNLSSDIFTVGSYQDINSTIALSICYSYGVSNMNKNIDNNYVTNKLNITSHILSLQGRLMFDNYFIYGSLVYNISNNNNQRTDTEYRKYSLSHECHSLFISSEYGIKLYSKDNFFFEPSVIINSYIHPEHKYYEYSDNIIHKLIPFSITAKTYYNLGIGLKLSCLKNKKLGKYYILSRLWGSITYDITNKKPDFNIGINKYSFSFKDHSMQSINYETGINISFLKDKMSFDIGVWLNNSNYSLMKCAFIVLNYSF